MSARTKKGLSYVIGDSNKDENHILPINVCQYSTYSNQLFTGGRDGAVKVWSPEKLFSKDDSPANFQFSDCFDNSDDRRNTVVEQDIDETILKLETSISSNPMSYSGSKNHDYGVINNFNLHFDWINDMKLVNNDRDLVTCSSDLSMKLVNLKPGLTSESLSQEEVHTHKFSNIHTDYIKKLSYIHYENLLASGGLDGKIVLWDLNTLKPIQEIENHSPNPNLPNSIYSLSNNGSNVIGTGGPNNIISLYDKRASQHSGLIRKLIGHQDNIRCLLMNDRYALSGSSDTSIKLWDLKTFKVYKNFDIHEDAVWSLTTGVSSSPGLLFQNDYNSEFEVFYSGDKSGRIVKTDIKYLSSSFSDEAHRSSTLTSSDYEAIDEKLGFSVVVAKLDSPIVSLCLENNVLSFGKRSIPSVFASTYDAMNRYLVPDTEQLSHYQYLREFMDYTTNHERQINDEIAAGLVEGATGDQNDLNSDFHDLVSHLSMDTNNLEIQSSISGANYPLSIQSPDIPSPYEQIDNSEYQTMFLDINGGPSLEYVNTFKEGLEKFKENDPIVDSTPVEILLNPVASDHVTLIPFNRRPVDIFNLVPKSIISKRMINNKRHMLVLYLNGDIKLWDIFICQVIKVFPYSSKALHPLTKELLENRLREMEDIFQDHQTLDILGNWCEAEIKAGKLMLTLKESSFASMEIYYDELVESYPFLAHDHPENTVNKKGNNKTITNDDRFYISALFLTSLFQNYILYEWEFDYHMREELKKHKKKDCKGSSTTISDELVSESVFPGGSTFRRLKLFGRIPSRSSMHLQLLLQAPQLQRNGLNLSQSSSFSDQVSKLAESSVSDFMTFSDNENKNARNEDSVMSLLQLNKSKYLEKINDGSKQVDLLLNTYYTNLDEVYRPLFSTSRFPQSLDIIIFEWSSKLGNLRDLCSFTVEDLSRLGSSATTSLVTELRLYLPRWIGRALLYSIYPTKESPKIAFLLTECDYATLPPDKKIGGKSQRKIKKLPSLESSIRLTSHNMLRVSKVLFYVTEKFESRTSEMKDRKPVSEWLAVECRGQELAPNMTLQAIKTNIWKSNTDIELKFRRKFD
ncbi:uncharacterized protein PRCAT00000885001 [Priceomyces carsonii]|uniref:uncharacterized protein n=1 Tax=Priceomyces carsonii TaxID=28549 RepID=UPI002ED8A675|nr:unnamed protein product [Priceomyces carsonii]